MDEKIPDKVAVEEGSVQEGTVGSEYDRYLNLHQQFQGKAHKQFVRKRKDESLYRHGLIGSHMDKQWITACSLHYHSSILCAPSTRATQAMQNYMASSRILECHHSNSITL